MSSKAERKLRKIAQGEDLSTLKRDPIQDPWLPIRAAGSLGAIDVVLCRGARVLLLEVKETGNTYADGTAKVNLTDGSGSALEQRDLLDEIRDDYQLHPSTFEVGFAVRRKGRITDGSPRWTWHPIANVHDDTVLRARDAPSLVDHMR